MKPHVPAPTIVVTSYFRAVCLAAALVMLFVMLALLMSSTPARAQMTLTPTPLDVATVTTGGTAVNALTAGHRTGGGWLQNPASATTNLCINELGTASGVNSAGNTTCIVPGQSYNIAPATGAVSVVASDAAHAFSGLGLQ